MGVQVHARSLQQGRDSMASRFCDTCRSFAKSVTVVVTPLMTGLHFHTYLEIKCLRIRAPLNPAPDSHWPSTHNFPGVPPRGRRATKPHAGMPPRIHLFKTNRR